MSDSPRTTYLDAGKLPYTFCPGCGHSAVIDALDAALVRLQLDPLRTVIVTDIGCAGISDRFLTTNAFHGLHGRSLTYASGIKLADPDLQVIVLIGDGGCGIGGNHLVNAARRNIGLTVLVFNNLNYGMTGGEHSVTTPLGGRTATTRYGNLERPLDVCATVGVNGASFAARLTSFDKDLPDRIVQAVECEGFSLLDIWELCTAYYAPNNRFGRRDLETTMDEMGFARGVLYDNPRPEYSRAYRRALSGEIGRSLMPPQPLEAQFQHHLERPLRILVAGAAGMRTRSAARVFSQGALLSGLWAAQRDDYPTTVRAGHSISEVTLSPHELRYAAAGPPDIVLALFPEGLKVIRPRLRRLDPQAQVYLQDGLGPVDTAAQTIPLQLHGPKQRWSLAALASLLASNDIYPLQALEVAAALRPAFADQNLSAIRSAPSL